MTDGYSGDGSSPSFNSFSNMYGKAPAQIFLEMCKMQGVNPTDGTEVHCDICFSGGEDSNGGFVLVERETGYAIVGGKYTYSCSKCKITYVDAKEEVRRGLAEKKIYNEYQRTAYKHNIGTNVTVSEIMDENSEFGYNVIDFKKRNEDSGWAAHITTKAKGGESVDAEEGYLTYKMCGHPDCRDTVPTKTSLPCEKCNLIYYCSEDCLDKHEKEHSPLCGR